MGDLKIETPFYKKRWFVYLLIFIALQVISLIKLSFDFSIFFGYYKEVFLDIFWYGRVYANGFDQIMQNSGGQVISLLVLILLGYELYKKVKNKIFWILISIIFVLATLFRVLDQIDCFRGACEGLGGLSAIITIPLSIFLVIVSFFIIRKTKKILQSSNQQISQTINSS